MASVAGHEAAHGAIAEAPLRPASVVMDLGRLGCLHPTRISFARTLVRRMAREDWRIRCERFDVDCRGVGTVVYAVETPHARLSFVAFAEHLEPEERTDRVIATRWDATFALIEGNADEATVARLSKHVPRQEAGRLEPGVLVLSRANRSVRLFDHVVERLADARQPDAGQIARVGYLMRTTAVYGNGKFGMSDLERMFARGVFRLPFQAEMLTVYLARHLSLELVQHLARLRAPDSAARLERRFARALGVGNATGLGMAPFLVTHPKLLNRWMTVRERALARARAVASASPEQRRRFPELLARARGHVRQWHTDDARQSQRIQVLRDELASLEAHWSSRLPALLDAPYPFDALYSEVAGRCSAETVELLSSLLIELCPREVDELEELTGGDEDERLSPAMTVRELLALIERDYGWAMAFDFDRPESQRLFWYVSQDKEEPRLGERGVDEGDALEMRLDVARQLCALYRDLEALPAQERERSVASWLLGAPRHRGAVRRVQSLYDLPYAEVRANLLDAACVPVDLLRCKLATLGASRFDPKSDRWTRITLFQGAPLADELHLASADDWWMPLMPEDA